MVVPTATVRPGGFADSPTSPEASRHRRRLPLADGISHVEDVFARLGAGGEQKLDADVLRAAFKELELPCTEKDIETLLGCKQREKLSKSEFTLFCILKDFQLRQVYNDVDKDGNGRITFEEFSTGMRSLGWGVSESRMKLIFDLEDSSPGLSYLEFRSLVVRSPDVLRNVADEFHTNRMTSFDVGGNNLQASKPREMSALINLIAGFVAGSFSRTLTAPAERIKTELQVAIGKPPSMVSLCRQVFRDGGVRGFFQGNLANCIKVAPQSALFFCLMDYFKRTLPTRGSPQHSDMHSFLSGSLAGMTSQLLIYPLEPIKTCLTVAPQGRYSGIIDCARKLVAQRGWRALFSGATPTLIGCVPYSGVQFAVYDGLQRAYIKSRHSEKPSFGVAFGCGLISSTIGMTVSYPLVVVRTRLQVQGTSPDKPVLYSGVANCFQKLYAQEGCRGLMRGVIPNLVKAAPAAAVNLAVYEQTKNFLQGSSSENMMVRTTSFLHAARRITQAEVHTNGS